MFLQIYELDWQIGKMFSICFHVFLMAWLFVYYFTVDFFSNAPNIFLCSEANFINK